MPIEDNNSNNKPRYTFFVKPLFSSAYNGDRLSDCIALLKADRRKGRDGGFLNSKQRFIISRHYWQICMPPKYILIGLDEEDNFREYEIRYDEDNHCLYLVEGRLWEYTERMGAKKYGWLTIPLGNLNRVVFAVRNDTVVKCVE